MKFINWLTGRTAQPDLSGLEILDHARVYLERYGDGRDQEFTRARNTLIQARVRVLSQQD